MPGIARKLIICAAIDGLIIQPLPSKGQRLMRPVQISYGDSQITPASRDELPDSSEPDSSFEAFGIIGLITVSRLSYLVSITKREEVAQCFGFPVYVVTEVAVTPCCSKTDAAASVGKTSQDLRKPRPQSPSDESDISDDEPEATGDLSDDLDDIVIEDGDTQPRSPRSSIAEDVFRRRGSYGRFAQQWFSRGGWTQEQKRSLGMSNPPVQSPHVIGTESASTSSFPPGEGLSEENVRVPTLLPKLLRTVQVLFGSSRSFFFSYDVDITRSFAGRELSVRQDTPLVAQAESLFFWNRHILEPFLDAGQYSLGLPLIQGFVGQRVFVVDTSPPQTDETGKESLELRSISHQELLRSYQSSETAKQSPLLRPSERAYSVTLLSRRSTQRAGLRYLRRGVNENGFTANKVETEQVLAPATWSWNLKSPMYSFVQVRGSIPLFFTQSPYSLKPAPMLQHSHEANYQACKKHFDRLAKDYGALQVVNLVEKHGIEEPLGTRYQRSVQRLNEENGNEKSVAFEWFDFHDACRGMKFENVNQLLYRLKDRLDCFGSTVKKDGNVTRTQRGVLRTNCMDCLDRTNVCQSSFAKYMLEDQLGQDGIDMDAQSDQENTWFNTLWADNGDAISKQYASTAAMKGDYTRTRKRDYRGALNDLGLSLARLYSGMVNDYFSQAAIDFLLGNVTAKVFDEFEADMMTKDPALSVEKMREQAVELCRKRVVADEKEEFHGGWVLLSPNTADTIKAWPLEEVVLLLTDAALYLCRFDWDRDKVSSFERVRLVNVTHVKFGTYITSTISTSHMDELRNVGLVVFYEPGKSNTRRTNTRTFSSQDINTSKVSPRRQKSHTNHPSSLVTLLAGRAAGPHDRKLVFKAPCTDSSTAKARNGPQQTEIQQVVTICAEIERLSFECQPHSRKHDDDTILEKGEIISLEAAKRNTSLFGQLGHSIKKFVWA